jgi:hypothetical protein
MPVSQYFKGKGEQVMAKLKARYGAERGERIFYALANKMGLTPPEKRRGTPRKVRIR